MTIRKEMQEKSVKVVMVDSLIGNPYSTCLSEGLQENGAEIHLIVPENRKFSRSEKFKVLYLSPSKSNDRNKANKIFAFIIYLLHLYRYIKSSKCDIVHYQFFRRKEEVLFFRFLKWRGAKLIITAHNVLPHESSKLDFYVKSLVYKSANAIIVHSDFIKNKIIQNFSINSNKINVIPHGNFDYYIKPNEITYEDSRKNFSLDISDNVMLFFGFIRPYKGLDLLLEAFEKAAEKDFKLKLIIAGNVIEGRESLIEEIARNKFSSRIHTILSFVPNEEVAKYFAAADVVVLPYKNIDHSGIIHLAYSFSKAVLATNVGDFNEVIEDGKSGKILNNNNPDEFADAIIDIFKDKSKLREMGDYGKFLNKTKYSWQDISKKTIQVYNKVIG